MFHTSRLTLHLWRAISIMWPEVFQFRGCGEVAKGVMSPSNNLISIGRWTFTWKMCIEKTTMDRVENGGGGNSINEFNWSWPRASTRPYKPRDYVYLCHVVDDIVLSNTRPQITTALFVSLWLLAITDYLLGWHFLAEALIISPAVWNTTCSHIFLLSNWSFSLGALWYFISP